MFRVSTFLLFFVACFCLKAQNLPNPYASIGKPMPQMTTLSGGKYDEFLLIDSVAIINGDVVSRRTGELLFELDDSTYHGMMRAKEAEFMRFLSVDLLTGNYPWYTPYQFAGNRPIQAIDLDGAEEWLVTGDQETSMTHGPYSRDYAAKNGMIATSGSLLPETKVTQIPSFVTAPTNVDEYIANKGIDFFAPKRASISSATTQWENDLADYNYKVETERWNKLSYEEKWNEAYSNTVLSDMAKNAAKIVTPIAELYTIQAEVGGSGLATGRPFVVGGATKLLIETSGTSIGEGVFVRFLKHAFSSNRHADLGLSVEKIAINTYELLSRNLSKLSNGNNTMHVTINGVQKTMMANVENNVVRSMNLYSGTSKRLTKGQIIKLGEVTWE